MVNTRNAKDQTAIATNAAASNNTNTSLLLLTLLLIFMLKAEYCFRQNTSKPMKYTTSLRKITT